MRGIIAPVAPAALRYARETSGRTPEELKKKFPDIDEWEAGDKPLTVAKARELAKFYDRSLTFLYLREIPEDLKDPPPPHDFRGRDEQKPLSFNLRRLLRQADARQKWVREFLEESPESRRFKKPPDFGNHPADAEVVGEQIRKWLNIDGGALKALKNNGDALDYWKECFDARGVMVLQSHRHHSHQVDTKEFNGCAMPDNAAPVVMLNSGDGDSKRIFTLAHELAHLWIDKPGLSRVSFRAAFSAADKDEAYCNRAAAAALLPRDDFVAAWNQAAGDDEKKINNIARIFKVSYSVVAIRAAGMEFIEHKRCDKLLEEYARYAATIAQKKKEKGGGGIALPDRQAVQRVGGYFAELTLDAYEQGAISALDVSYLLDTKLDHLGKIAERLNFPLHRWSSP